jgi:putative membrane protein
MTAQDDAYPSVGTVFAILLAVPVVVMGLLMALSMLVGGGHGGMGMGTAWMLVMPLLPVGVLTLAYYLFVTARRGGSGTASRRPIDELRAAYARGDLTDAEFETRREELASDDTVHGSGVSADD